MFEAVSAAFVSLITVTLLVIYAHYLKGGSGAPQIHSHRARTGGFSRLAAANRRGHVIGTAAHRRNLRPIGIGQCREAPVIVVITRPAHVVVPRCSHPPGCA